MTTSRVDLSADHAVISTRTNGAHEDTGIALVLYDTGNDIEVNLYGDPRTLHELLDQATICLENTPPHSASYT